MEYNKLSNKVFIAFLAVVVCYFSDYLLPDCGNITYDNFSWGNMDISVSNSHTDYFALMIDSAVIIIYNVTTY